MLASGTTNGSRPLLPDKAIVRSNSSPLRCMPSDSSALNDRDWYAVEYFRGQTSFQLPGCSHSTSWETLALRLSHTEPAIKAAIIALGSIHRSRGPDPPCGYSPQLDSYHYEFALRHYAQALASVQKCIDQSHELGLGQSIEVVLISCLMFISFEILQGSYELSRLHLKTGLRILGEHVDPRKSGRAGRPTVRLEGEPSTALSILSQAFVCLDCDMTMSGDCNPDLHATVEDDYWQTTTAFRSLNEARLHLNILTNAVRRTRAELEAVARVELQTTEFSSNDVWRTECWVETRSRMVDLDTRPDVRAEVADVEKRVAAWSSAFACMSTTGDKTEAAHRKVLQVQFLETWFISAMWRSASEAKSDRCFSVFSQITSLSEQLLEMRPTPGSPEVFNDAGGDSTWQLIGRGSGIMLALYHVATKCRDSAIRHKALALIEQTKVQEGFCSSALLSVFARAIVDLEEERLHDITGHPLGEPYTCNDVPAEVRIIEVLMDANTTDLGFGRLLLSTPRADDSDGFDVWEHRFDVSTPSPRSNTISPGPSSNPGTHTT